MLHQARVSCRKCTVDVIEHSYDGKDKRNSRSAVHAKAKKVQKWKKLKSLCTMDQSTMPTNCESDFRDVVNRSYSPSTTFMSNSEKILKPCESTTLPSFHHSPSGNSTTLIPCSFPLAYNLVNSSDEEFNSESDEASCEKSLSINWDLCDRSTFEPIIVSKEEDREVSASATGVADFPNSEIPDGSHAAVLECPRCHCYFYTRRGRRLLRRHLADGKCQLRSNGVPSITPSTPIPSSSTATGSTSFNLSLDCVTST